MSNKEKEQLVKVSNLLENLEKEFELVKVRFEKTNQHEKKCRLQSHMFRLQSEIKAASLKKQNIFN